MYQDALLESALRMNSMIESKPLIAAEFNMNKVSNIDAYGVYKNTSTINPSLRWLPADPRILTAKYYSSDELFVEIGDGDYAFEYNEQKKLDLYYDLAECFKPNRPRSGINKMLFFPGQYVDDLWNADRPRFYYADPTDRFKYWTSYRNYGAGLETGISNDSGSIQNAAPFVVYKSAVPANKIVVKIQTLVGESVDGSYAELVGIDPLNDESNSAMPSNWRIQYLDETNTWVTAASNPTLKADGYVELGYTVLAPIGYEESFLMQGYAATIAELPATGVVGDGWVVGQTASAKGDLYVWNGQDWIVHQLNYGFKQQTAYDDQASTMEKIVNPRGWVDAGKTNYAEFVMLKGLRIIVDSMVNANKSFDLIEMSPRLAIMLTDYVESYSIDKVTGSDDGIIPVSGLLASAGTLELFNGDGAFTFSNVLNGLSGSVVAEHLLPLTKIYIWENLTIGGERKFIPLKVLNVEQWPEATSPSTSISLQLRDNFIIFESERALDVLRQNMTLTGAVSWLLDSVGFSNYVFRGFGLDSGKVSDPIIPFFFSNADLNIAEILNELCKATQSMMYFDEYNNFVVVSKEYTFNTTRSTDFEFTGTDEPDLLANIEQIDSSNRQFFNNGNIRYTDRYIQRAVNSLQQAGQHDKWRTWTYQPVLLWEVSGTEQTKTRNGSTEMQSGFALSAAVLNSDLTDQLPTVSNGVLINNIIDVGDSAYWLARNEGHFYSNGEIIQYDAVEYAVPGQNPATVWIQNNEEYQYYFSRVPFKGRIFPTGRVRIFAEPFYNDDGTLKEGAVKSHGRGKFSTTVTAHKSRLRDYWKDVSNTRVLKTDSKFIFNEYAYHRYMYSKFAPDAGYANASLFDVSQSATRWSIDGSIKDMWAEWYQDENGKLIKDPGAIQSSALVFDGIDQQYDVNVPLRDIMQVATKPRNGANFVGSRMRLIGQEKNGLGQTSQPLGNFSMDFMPRDGSQTFLSGGSAGIGTFISRTKHTGYYFELVAYAEDVGNITVDSEDDPMWVEINTTSGSPNATIKPYSAIEEGNYITCAAFPFGTRVTAKNGENITLSANATQSLTEHDAYFTKFVDGQAKAVHNVIFYKTVPGTVSGVPSLVPVKLWGGLAEILVDQGIFVGQSRSNTSTTPTVYDLGIEHFVQRGIHTFNLYVNGKIIAIVEDKDSPTSGAGPQQIIDQGDHAGMFVRGSSVAMFENFLMLKPNTNSQSVETSPAFGEALAKPKLNKMINFQASPFLVAAMDGTTTGTYGKYSIDYEEFGTILRECMYFNVRYNQAFPAFYSVIAPTVSDSPSFHVSNYNGGPYKAEFLVFNTADKTVILDETSGDYLRILGVTFTQANERTLSVDDYVKKMKGGYSALFNKLNASRKEYGEKSFSFDSIFIQNKDAAAGLLEWFLERMTVPRREVEIKTFWVPTVQLGDIVTVSYEDETGIYIDKTKQMIVTRIQMSRGDQGPQMTIRAVER